jgi:hypothetical protein
MDVHENALPGDDGNEWIGYSETGDGREGRSISMRRTTREMIRGYCGRTTIPCQMLRKAVWLMETVVLFFAHFRISPKRSIFCEAFSLKAVNWLAIPSET